MILTDLGPVTAYRMHTPRWATAPASGVGRRHMAGGRIDQALRPSTVREVLRIELDRVANGEQGELA